MTATPKHFIVYGKGLSTDLVTNIRAKTKATMISASQGTYIDGGMPFVEFWPKVAGYGPAEVKQGKDDLKNSVVTIVQSVGRPYSENFVYAKLAADNAKRFGAKLVHMIFPFYDLREDKEFPDRGTSFANPLFARELAAAGVDFVTFIAPHSKAGVQQFSQVFGKNVSVVEMPEIMVPIIMERFNGNVENLANGSPDGWDKPDDQARQCAEATARALHGEQFYLQHLFGIKKLRTGVGESKVLEFHGDVQGKSALLGDDMIDSGGTIVHGGEQADQHGAIDVFLSCAHGIFSKGLSLILAAHNKNGGLLVKQVITTNSLRVEDAVREVVSQFPDIHERIHIADVSPFVIREMDKVLERASQVARESAANRRRGFGIV